ncbi:hypothetical protein [Amycolatopsis sp. NPDC003676]
MASSTSGCGTSWPGEVPVGLTGQGFYAKAWLSPAGRAPDLDVEEPGVQAEAG